MSKNGLGSSRGVLQLAEKHTLYSGGLGDLQNQIRDRIAQGESLVIDFAKTRSIDGAFLGVLAASWRDAQKVNKKLLVCNLDESCRRLMTLCHFDTIWDLSLSEADA
jgi:anti-anti-sigma regulatory factor